MMATARLVFIENVMKPILSSAVYPALKVQAMCRSYFAPLFGTIPRTRNHVLQSKPEPGTKDPESVLMAYTAKDITVLEGLEPVRRRPGMYIGGVGSAGLHHLVLEILDNSIDEAMNGHASNIWVTLHPDGSSVTIQDNGRGVPMDNRPQARTT